MFNPHKTKLGHVESSRSQKPYAGYTGVGDINPDGLMPYLGSYLSPGQSSWLEAGPQQGRVTERATAWRYVSPPSGARFMLCRTNLHGVASAGAWAFPEFMVDPQQPRAGLLAGLPAWLQHALPV